MTDCAMCHQPCLDGQDLVVPTCHAKCDNEYDMRHAAGKCVGCGENDMVAGYNRCHGCMYDPIRFKGYEGP